MKLMTATIKLLELPPGEKDKVFFDERLPGFGLRIRASGVRTWMVQYSFGGRDERLALGPPTVLSPDQAFKAAKDLLAKVRLVTSPMAEKRAPRYLDHKRPGLKPRTFAEVRRHLLNHAKPIHKLPVNAVTNRTIAALLDDVGKASGPAARNNLRSYLSAFFVWLAREGFIGANPVSITVKATVKSRDHLLDDGDVKVILAALDDPSRVDDDHNDIVRLLLLLGHRRDEVGSLRWNEVDLENGIISFPSGRTKNGKSWIVPLSVPAIAILRARAAKLDPASRRECVFGRTGDTGFSGWSKGKAELDAAIAKMNGKPMAGWRLHDLRRLISTSLNERLGVDHMVVESILGHAVPGVAGVYNRNLYLSERKRALDCWAAHLEWIATGKAPDATVVNLGKGRQSRTVSAE